MRTRPLGARSGIEVTGIGLGLWAVPGFEWGPGEEQDILEAIEVAREGGVNFFDTADVYGPDLSEELLGKAVAGRRDEFVIGTKIGWKGWDATESRSQYETVDKLVSGVEESLRRLGTEYLDLIQCHISFEEPNTSIFMEGFRRLKEEGKVRAWGVSTGVTWAICNASTSTAIATRSRSTIRSSTASPKPTSSPTARRTGSG